MNENLGYLSPQIIFPGGYFFYMLETIMLNAFSIFLIIFILKYKVDFFMILVCIFSCCCALVCLIKTINLVLKKIYIKITDEYFEIKTTFSCKSMNVKDIKFVTTVIFGSSALAFRKIAIRNHNNNNWGPSDIMFNKEWFSKKDIKRMKEILSSINPEIEWGF